MATATSFTDVDAIFKAYPSVVRINQDEGCYDASDSLVVVDQDNVDAARTELDKLKYQTDRTGGTGLVKTGTYYAEMGDQLDMLYKDIVAGKLDTTGTWATHIKSVKDANPKP